MASYTTMTFSQGGNSALVGLPQYSYNTTVELGLKMREKYDGNFAIYDPGATYDRRICKMTVQWTAAEQLDFETLISDADESRGEKLTLTLPASSGFFPFGADKGDSGAFEVVVLPFSSSGVQSSPKQYFRTEITMIATSFPVYALPIDATDYGTMTIGTVSGLQFPENYFQPENSFKYAVAVTEGTSGIDILDLGETSDSFNNNFTVKCREVKAANLLNYLTGSARGSSFQLTTASNQYPFGALKGGSGTYNVTLAESSIQIQNNGADQFYITMALNWESTA